MSSSVVFVEVVQKDPDTETCKDLVSQAKSNLSHDQSRIATSVKIVNILLYVAIGLAASNTLIIDLGLIFSDISEQETSFELDEDHFGWWVYFPLAMDVLIIGGMLGLLWIVWGLASVLTKINKAECFSPSSSEYETIANFGVMSAWRILAAISIYYTGASVSPIYQSHLLIL